MFDFSFGEILLTSVVALVVLGPERLPAVARTLGALVARAQRFVASVKADIGEHTELSTLVSLKQEVQNTAYAFKEQLTAEVDEVSQTIHQARQETVEALEAAKAEIVAPPADDLTPMSAASVVVPTPVPAGEPPAAQNEPERPPVDDNQLDLFAELTPTPARQEPPR
ncbi:twin-arginine translocase TatA/TatE family subunit [Paludibacterium sp. B53371]|uniref:twin-arginine translocase TatA/TatE family subunit n=1 Tax=Paludibacterium sp. B53371 TaxID=2806263 RepID=UPI001C03DDAA|nr:twin-arginine translocase TatA/TatE family subunit [Paludibacterium sp. B53371]